jgi:hypothetical protein
MFLSHWWFHHTTPHVIFVDCDLVANTHNFVLFCCSFLWCHFYYKLVCNMGFKTRFQGCSRKGGHENKNHYGTITPNGNTQHFIFKHVKHTFEYILLSTCLCYLFPFICVFCFKIYGLQESIFHCSLLVLNLDAHESI